MLFFSLFLMLFAFVLEGQNFLPTTRQELIDNINEANANDEDDLIDLRDRTFLLNAIQDAGSNSCLPVIDPDNAHSLTIINGHLEIDQSVPGLRCRHFTVADDAELILENMTLKFGLLDQANNGGSILNLGSLSLNFTSF